MDPAAQSALLSSGDRYLGPAVVTQAGSPDGWVLVRLGVSGPGPVRRARLAIPNPAELVVRQEVLVVAGSGGELYVIGVLSRPDSSPAGPERVYSARRELLFEYDPVAEKARVNIARGSLELATQDGDICLDSARSVRIKGRAIDMCGSDLTVRTSRTRLITDRLETFAKTVVEKARNVYRTVTQLAQTRSGRMRTLVDETYQLKSKKAYLKSEEDFKVKGEKIHLG